MCDFIPSKVNKLFIFHFQKLKNRGKGTVFFGRMQIKLQNKFARVRFFV